MSTVLLIVHVMIAAALIGVVLLQRSEGGALGIGGGGGGGFMTGRGAANLLTRVTAGLAAAFFATSLLLSIIATRTEAPRSILDAPAGAPGQPARPQGAPTGSPGLPQIDLNKIPDAPLPADPPKVPQSK